MVLSHVFTILFAAMKWGTISISGMPVKGRTFMETTRGRWEAPCILTFLMVTRDASMAGICGRWAGSRTDGKQLIYGIFSLKLD